MNKCKESQYNSKLTLSKDNFKNLNKNNLKKMQKQQ